MTLFQYIDLNIERTSLTKSASWKRKHNNALQAVKAYCDNKDVDLTSLILPGWINGLKDHFSNTKTFSQSTAQQYKDIFKTIYASAVNNGFLPPIKLNELCKGRWDEREEQNYKDFNLINQIKILDYKNLDKEQSNIRDLYLISIACMGAELSTLFSLEKTALQENIITIEGLKFELPQLLLDKINSLNARSDKFLPIRAFYKGEAKDPLKALKLKIRDFFKTLNLNLYQNGSTFSEWLIIAKEAGIPVDTMQQIVALKLLSHTKRIGSDISQRNINLNTSSENRPSNTYTNNSTTSKTEDDHSGFIFQDKDDYDSMNHSPKNSSLQKENPSWSYHTLNTDLNSIENLKLTKDSITCSHIKIKDAPLSKSIESEDKSSIFSPFPSVVLLSPTALTRTVYNVTQKLEVVTSNWYLVRILRKNLTGEQLVKKLKKNRIITLSSGEYYAPVYKIKRIRNGVTEIVNSSDTERMLFVRTSLKQIQNIERIEEGGLSVARNIKGGKYAIIPSNELQRMRDFIEGSNQEIFLLQNSDYIGRKVIVTKGSYAGWEGEILKKSTSAIRSPKRQDLKSDHNYNQNNDNYNQSQSKEDYDNTIFIVQFLNSLKWAVPVSGLEFKFID